MSDSDLQREMARLAERLERIERRLGIETDVAATAGAPPAVDTPKHQAFRRLFQGEAQAPVSETAAPPPVVMPSPPIPRRREPIIPLKPAPAFPAPAAPPLTPPTVPTPVQPDESQGALAEDLEWSALARLAADDELETATASPPPSQSARPSSTPLEVLIGGKWMAWVGAIVVIIAAGFAVKVGIDQGWWGALSPMTRCLTIAAFGAALLAAGEVALRRIGKPAAAGLISAGLGTLYLDAFATFRGFRPPLVSQEWAFVLMALVAIGGFALTIRTRFLTIGVLSIIGGYLTPILLRGDSTHDIELLLYLSMLLGVSLALAGLMRSPFGALRFVALGGHLIVAFAWVVTNTSQWRMAMFFMSAWWVMVLIESMYTAIKGRAALGNVIMTLIATAAYVTGGCLLLRIGSATSAEWMGAFAAMVAIIGGIAALQFGGGIEALRGWVRRPIDLLTVALWLQCGVLIATAIALQFQGFGQAIGWLMMGLAAIEMGRRLPSRGVTIFGLIIGALATLRVCTLPVVAGFGLTSSVLQPLFSIGEFEVSPWAILAIINVVGLHVAAHRLPRTAGWRSVRIVLAAIASMIWMGLCMHQADGLTVTAGWLLGAVALLAMWKFEFAKSAAYLDIALAMLAATAGRWLVIDAMLHRLDRAWRADSAVPFLNWQMALAAAIAGVGWWACRALGQREREPASQSSLAAISGGQVLFWQVVLLGGAIFGLIAICFEIDRGVAQAALHRASGAFAAGHVRQLLFTLAWAMGSVLIAVLARTLAGSEENGISRTWLLRRFAWGLLTICAVKWIMFDATTLFAMRHDLFAAATPLLNLQMIVGAALAVALLALGAIMTVPREDQESVALSATHPLLLVPRDLRSWMPVLAGCMLLWGLTFEIDRLLTRAAPLPQWLDAFGSAHQRALLWTALWVGGAAAMFGIGRARSHAGLFGSGILMTALASVAWLTIDTLTFRFTDPPAPAMPFVNLQFAVGVACAIALLIMARVVRDLSPDDSDVDSARRAGSLQPRMLAHLLLAIVGAIGLWLGSIEIDRIFASPGESMVKQAGLSVWWAVYAVGLVVLGFARRPPMAAVRYAGLGLLSLTVVKVLLIDFANLDSLPRVLSFAGAGMLLILTSVVYAKLSPRLLRSGEES